MSKLTTTQDRLLESAAEVFAKKGFRGATVAEICEQADANVAAINYHFGDKESLYEQVWQVLFSASDKKYPLPDLEEAGADIWLRCFLRSRLNHISDTGLAGKLPQLIQCEMANPSDASERLILKHLQPKRERLVCAVKDYLGPQTLPHQLQCATFNFSSLYIFMNLRTNRRGGMEPLDLANTEQEQLIDQTVEFAMAGLEQTRKMVEKNP